MSEWQPIATAPKGIGANDASDAAYAETPLVLLYFPSVELIEVGYWDWFYGAQGSGHVPGLSGWCVSDYHPAALCFGEPSHWMPMPEPPRSSETEATSE